jgi:hypothetical protein
MNIPKMMVGRVRGIDRHLGDDRHGARAGVAVRFELGAVGRILGVVDRKQQLAVGGRRSARSCSSLRLGMGCGCTSRAFRRGFFRRSRRCVGFLSLFLADPDQIAFENRLRVFE